MMTPATTPTPSSQNTICRDIAALVLRRQKVEGDRQQFIEQIQRVLEENNIGERLAGSEHVFAREELAQIIQDGIKGDLAFGEMDDAYIRNAIAKWEQGSQQALKFQVT